MEVKRRQLAGEGFLPRCLASPPKCKRVRRVKPGATRRACTPLFVREAWRAQHRVLSKAPQGGRGEGATSKGPALVAAPHPARA